MVFRDDQTTQQSRGKSSKVEAQRGTAGEFVRYGENEEKGAKTRGKVKVPGGAEGQRSKEPEL